MQGLVEQEGLLVTLGGEGVDLRVLALLIREQLGLALFENALGDELVVEVLVGSADADGRVLEDELGVALGGERADEVELALGKFYEGFLGAGAEDKLANCGERKGQSGVCCLRFDT